MTSEDGRDGQRRIVRGKDSRGATRYLVLQEVNGHVAALVGPDPVYLDPPAVSKAIEHLRDLQARAMRGVQWNV